MVVVVVVAATAAAGDGDATLACNQTTERRAVPRRAARDRKFFRQSAYLPHRKRLGNDRDRRYTRYYECNIVRGRGANCGRKMQVEIKASFLTSSLKKGWFDTQTGIRKYGISV